jgi:hypothetical protein
MIISDCAIALPSAADESAATTTHPAVFEQVEVKA